MFQHTHINTFLLYIDFIKYVALFLAKFDFEIIIDT